MIPWWRCGTSEVTGLKTRLYLGLLVTSDNRYYVKLIKSRDFASPLWLSLLLLSCLFASEYSLQVGSKSLQGGNSFWRGFDYFLFVNKDFAAIPLHQRSQTFSHPPANIAQNLQAVRSRHKKCQTAIAKDSHGLGKTLKGLQAKAGEIETLELVFGIGHEKELSRFGRFASIRGQKKASTSCICPGPRHSALPTTYAGRRTRCGQP